MATPRGSPPEVDDRSVDPERVGEERAEELRQVHETDERLNDPVPVAEADAADYEALVLPGGHGTEWDVNQDSHVRSLLREQIETDGAALVVCHAVGILAFARDREGNPIGAGRDVTGFPYAWEEGIVDGNDRLPDGRKLPYRVEDEVVAAGVNFDPELEEEASVRVDGNLATARGPESSAAAARTLLSELGVDARA